MENHDKMEFPCRAALCGCFSGDAGSAPITRGGLKPCFSLVEADLICSGKQPQSIDG
jgi:hypothetical protein